MPQIPSGLLAGASVTGIVDGTTVTGATLIADGTQGQILVYEGTPETGSLIGSWSGLASQDPYANTFPLGLALQGSGTVFTVVGPSGQNIVIEYIGGVPYLGLQTGAAEEGQAGGMEAEIGSPGASEQLITFLNGPQGTTYTDRVWITLYSQAKDGSSDALGVLNLGNAAGSHDWLTWGPNGITVYSPIAGDTNAYQTERLTLNMPGNAPVTINTNPYSQQLFGTPGNLGAGTYHVRGQLLTHPIVTGGSPSFGFAGSAAYTGMRVLWSETDIQNPYLPVNMTYVTAPTPSGFSGSPFGSDDRVYAFDGTVVVSTAGNFALYAGVSNTSDTYSVYGYGTYMEISPIGPA